MFVVTSYTFLFILHHNCNGNVYAAFCFISLTASNTNKFSIDYEAFTLEFLRNHDDMFSWYMYSAVCNSGQINIRLNYIIPVLTT